MKKYEILKDRAKEIRIDSKPIKVYRIRALKEFGDVRVGDIGGYVSSELNLNHNDDCWIYNDAIVCQGAILRGNSKVYDRARVYGSAFITGDVGIYHNARVFGNAIISKNVIIANKAKVYDSAEISEHAQIVDNAKVYDKAKVRGFSVVSGYAELCANADIYRSDDFTSFVDLSKELGGCYTVFKTSDLDVCIKYKHFVGCKEDFEKYCLPTRYELSSIEPYEYDALINMIDQCASGIFG